MLKQKIHPDKTIDAWGFNGSAPGPTIQVNQGDHVRVIFDNHLPEPSSIHWHGFEDAVGYDGMPVISQEPVKPGGRFVYEFDIHQAGTYFYHSHMAMQEMTGMLGGFIMHPRTPYHPHCDKDFLLHLQEYQVLPNNTVPNTMNMEYNWLLLNGKAGPATTPLIVRQGDRVRIRFVNLGMDHHPMHLHGYTFQVTGTEGGRIPETAWWPGNTVLVGVAQARDVEIIADRPGDWMLHCHLPHHMMNQMSSNAGSMNRLGNTSDTETINGPLSQKAMPGMAAPGDIADNADSVPGFPQDAYMEGPAMAMDSMVEKPELLTSSRLERLHDGHDDLRQGTAAGEIRPGDGPYEAGAKAERSLRIATRASFLTFPGEHHEKTRAPVVVRHRAAFCAAATDGRHANG